jgi:hypothetical protein
MASLVSEILMSAGEIGHRLLLFQNLHVLRFNSISGQYEKRDLQTELEKVKRKIDDAKFQVSKFVEQHYLDFDPLLVHSRELVETSSKLSEELEELVAKAETEVNSYCINFITI